MIRTAVRASLLPIAILSAIVTGFALVCTLDPSLRSAPVLREAQVVAFVSLAIGLAAMLLRAFIRPRLHRDRVEARAEFWNDFFFVLSYGLMSVIVGGSLLILNWPAWLAALAGTLMLIAQVWFVVTQAARRNRLKWDGLCPICGYDMRGLPEPRCPECGTKLDAEKKAADQ